MNKEKLIEAAVVFADYFALVFDNDWEFTKGWIDEPFMIAPDGTFIHPKVEDEENNWANRARLLESYRELSALLKDAGIQRWGHVGN